MARERQSVMDMYPRPRRRRAHRRNYKRLPISERQGELNRWLSQKMLMLYYGYSEVWKTSEGADIVRRAGHNVEDGTAEMEGNCSRSVVKNAIEKGKMSGIPASDMVRALASVTKTMAYQANDRDGWTASYFGDIVDLIVVETYHETQSYAEELKRKELPNAFMD